MEKEETEVNRDSGSSTESKSKSRRKSAFRSLASDEYFGNGISDDDDGRWAEFDDSKRSTGSARRSMASNATLTSPTRSNNSHSNGFSSRSPRVGLSSSFHKSPKRSPRPCLRNSNSDDESSAIRAARQIPTLPFTSEEDDRRQEKNHRRRGSRSPPPPDVNGLYYQPSKASLHDRNINVPTKKPQRIRKRSNSKGATRRKSYGDHPNSSFQQTNEGSTSTHGSSHSHGSSHGSSHGRGRSPETPQPVTKSKKKSSPPASQNRKQPTNTKKLSAQGKVSSADFHESWPRTDSAKAKERKEVLDKSKRKTPKIKSKSNQKNKEAKEKKDEISNGIISFLEDVATKNSNGSTTASQRKDRSGGFFKMKKSNSARSVKRSSATAAGDSNTFPDRRNRGSHERRSSAPAKAFAALTSYRKALLPVEFDYEEDEEESEPFSQPLQPPKEKILLDVSELAALEIIRLGQDNSLKLDLFDLVNHLRQQQSEKSGHNR